MALQTRRYDGVMTWHSSLTLNYTASDRAKTTASFVHNGPLRILKSLYPEGDAICHNVLVHPPGGLAGGDVLDINVKVAKGAHGLVTTPSATRFYRSDGDAASQHSRLQVQASARLEWLPLEAIAHPGCLADNRLTLQLEPGSEMIGWDVAALGLPHSGQPFDTGSYCQHIEMPGVWLERGRVQASDQRLRFSQLGLAGNTCMASLFFAVGSDLPRPRRERALDAARHILHTQAVALAAGVTSPNARVVVVRALAPQVEPALNLLKQIWACWRTELWQLPTDQPRIWAM